MRTKLTLITVLFCSLAISRHSFALVPNFSPTPFDFIFYTFLLSGISLAGCLIWALKESKWFPYVLLSLLLTLNAFTMDGALTHTLKYLSISHDADYVTWVAPLLTTLASAAFGYLLVARFTEALPHKVLWVNSAYVLSITSIFILISSPFWLERIPLPWVWIPAQFLFLGMIVAQVVPPISWRSKSIALRTYIRGFSLVIACIAVLGFAALKVFSTADQVLINSFYKLGLILFGVFSLTAVVWQAFERTQEKVEAERDAAMAAKDAAETKLALKEAEYAYEEARSLALKHQKQLSNVSHDLKQPISALKSAIENIDPNSSTNVDKLRQAIDYVETLSGSYLEHQAESTSHVDHQEEPLQTQMLAKVLEQMFSTECEGRNIKLRVHAGRFQLNADPLVVMRIMTNLVGNAIAHSKATKILIGFRKVSEGLMFQVHDNGIGLESCMQESLFEVGVKSELSSGQGLGLAIVRELCDSNDCLLNVVSHKGRGSSFYVLFR